MRTQNIELTFIGGLLPIGESNGRQVWAAVHESIRP